MTKNGYANELPENEQPEESEVNLAEEFAALGRKFGEAFETAWNSQERENIQAEIRAGLRRFADEVDGVIAKAKETDAASKVEESAKRVTEDVKSGKVVDEARAGVVSGLKSISEALDKMANSFTPAEGEKETPKE